MRIELIQNPNPCWYASINWQYEQFMLLFLSLLTHNMNLWFPSVSLYSVEGEAPGSEAGPSLENSGGYLRGPVSRSAIISGEHFDGPPLYVHEVRQRPRRPKLQHSQSILRKQAEEEAIKRSRSLSESYELSTDLQDKQVEFFRIFNWKATKKP